MERAHAVDSTSLRSAEDSTLTPATTTRPNDSEQDSAKQRSCKTERWLMSLAWILAISSFLYLMSLTLIYVWFASSSQTDSEFAGDLSSLASSSRKGSFLRALFHGSNQRFSSEPHVQIPRIIHQTYKSNEIPEEMRRYVSSWKERNPSWQYVFYNDTDCLEFVQREFPHYLKAYQSLPKNVERSDFFRYLVVLRYGGVYADLDAECMVPLDQFLQPEDVFVVGWECDTASEEAAIKRHFVRRRQIVQWVFAAAPGHPVLQEICEFIARNSLTQFSNVSSNHNTLEKTGPGAWTDAILRHTARSDAQIRILPQVAFGVHPSGTDGLHPGSDGIFVQHHFLGSWKRGGWGERPIFYSLFHSHSTAMSIIKPAPVAYFPVSATFTPPFTMMVHPCSAGQFVGNSDVSSEVTLRGSWQAGTHSLQSPRVVDVIAGSLGNVHMHLHLVDFGAGLGFFSLAAASRHHPVVAFEPPGSNIEPLKQSIQANNFTDRVRLFTSTKRFKQAMHPLCMTPKTDPWKQRSLQSSNVPPSDASVGACQMEVGALRVGNSGWSAWKALNGSTYVQRFEPEIVAIEFSPWSMRKAGMEEPEAILHELVNLGYGEVYHAGNLCERRWHILSKHVQDLQYEDKPTWCIVSPSDFSIFQRIEENEHIAPENVLFVKRKSQEVS